MANDVRNDPYSRFMSSPELEAIVDKAFEQMGVSFGKTCMPATFTGNFYQMGRPTSGFLYAFAMQVQEVLKDKFDREEK